MTTVTSKGQVTIPKRVRDALGIKPGSKVEFGLEKPGRAFVQAVGKTKPSDIRQRLEKVRGTLKDSLSTDEIMQLLRGG